MVHLNSRTEGTTLRVFVVLAVQYERLSNPLIILTAAPLALLGVTSILYLTETALSAPVLIGIVVNNAILLAEYIEIGRRRHGYAIIDVKRTLTKPSRSRS